MNLLKDDFQDTIDAEETTVELRLCANSNWNKPSVRLLRPAGGKFCQFCIESECSKAYIAETINLECKLREINFDSNDLGKIFFEDLMDLNNLEYLNLENNRISFIEASSFSNLMNLKTLILSRNQIVFIKETYYLFDTFETKHKNKLNRLTA